MVLNPQDEDRVIVMIMSLGLTTAQAKSCTSAALAGSPPTIQEIDILRHFNEELHEPITLETLRETLDDLVKEGLLGTVKAVETDSP